MNGWRRMLIKEEGVGINCSEPGLLVQAVLGTMRGRWVRTPWRHSSQMTGLPQSPSVPAGCQGSGDWKGALQASWLGQAGRKTVRLCPAAPLPHPSPTSLIRVPAMLGNTPGPPFTWVLAHPLPSYFLSSSAIGAPTIPVPSASHLGLRGAQLLSSRYCWGGARCGCDLGPLPVSGRLRN